MRIQKELVITRELQHNKSRVCWEKAAEDNPRVKHRVELNILWYHLCVIKLIILKVKPPVSGVSPKTEYKSQTESNYFLLWKANYQFKSSAVRSPIKHNYISKHF